ncbi:MAG: hypothetical protein ACK5PF_01170 [bacterium]
MTDQRLGCRFGIMGIMGTIFRTLAYAREIYGGRTKARQPHAQGLQFLSLSSPSSRFPVHPFGFVGGFILLVRSFILPFFCVLIPILPIKNNEKQEVVTGMGETTRYGERAGP